MNRQLALLEDRADARLSDEPHVIIRESKRARHLTLKLMPPYRLELVVPPRTRPQAVEAFLAGHREWIRRANAELAARYPAERRRLPAKVVLAAIDRCWTVRIDEQSRGRTALRELHGCLEMTVAPQSDSQAFEVLRCWLLRQGRAYLRPWLGAEAQRLGLSPKRVQIRTQRTRWGSCSQRGNISLNAALLLLPPHLVRYLLVHELCHLQHLNHSSRFWRLVERYEPKFKAHDRALAAAWTEIPMWALPR